jgi:hypothetical protein
LKDSLHLNYHCKLDLAKEILDIKKVEININVREEDCIVISMLFNLPTFFQKSTIDTFLKMIDIELDRLNIKGISSNKNMYNFLESAFIEQPKEDKAVAACQKEIILSNPEMEGLPYTLLEQHLQLRSNIEKISLSRKDEDLINIYESEKETFPSLLSVDESGKITKECRELIELNYQK